MANSEGLAQSFFLLEKPVVVGMKRPAIWACGRFVAAGQGRKKPGESRKKERKATKNFSFFRRHFSVRIAEREKEKYIISGKMLVSPGARVAMEIFPYGVYGGKFGPFRPLAARSPITIIPHVPAFVNRQSAQKSSQNFV